MKPLDAWVEANPTINQLAKDIAVHILELGGLTSSNDEAALLRCIMTSVRQAWNERWQSIETAPKDGTIIIACCEYDIKEKYGLQSHPQTVRWEVYHPNAPGKGVWRDKNGHKQNHVTHWMPLPEGPQ